MIPDRFAPVLAELAPLAARFEAAGHRLYLVGGTVRDLLVDSGRQDFDLDLTTDARPPQIKACLEGWAEALWTQGERFGTIGAKFGDRTYEITTFRAESYTDDSRKPHVTYADEIEVDLGRRDFTVNAMALELTGGETPTLVDPHGGAGDLMQKVLRTPLGPEVSFSDDPLRMLRAARFIAGYDLEPTEALVTAVKEMASRLEIVSAGRIRDEFDKLHDDLFVLACAVDAVERDLAKSVRPSIKDVTEALDWLLDAAKQLTSTRISAPTTPPSNSS